MQFDNLYTAERFMSTLSDNKIKSAGVARKNQVDPHRGGEDCGEASADER